MIKQFKEQQEKGELWGGESHTHEVVNLPPFSLSNRLTLIGDHRTDSLSSGSQGFPHGRIPRLQAEALCMRFSTKPNALLHSVGPITHESKHVDLRAVIMPILADKLWGPSQSFGDSNPKHRLLTRQESVRARNHWNESWFRCHRAGDEATALWMDLAPLLDSLVRSVLHPRVSDPSDPDR
jgi:hypothetical protein